MSAVSFAIAHVSRKPVYFRGEGCQIPDNVTGWTIHGLWPSCNGGFGPEYCNNSWPLTTSSIYDLEDKLRAQWKSFAGTASD